MKDEMDRLGRFEDAWRRWATRSPGRGPSEAVRNAAEALRRRRERRRLRQVVLAAAAAVLIAVPLLVRHSTPPPVGSEGMTVPDLPVAEGQVLIWLDEVTPLYMTFQPPEGSGGSGGWP